MELLSLDDVRLQERPTKGDSVKSLNGHRQTLKEVARFLYISCNTPTKFFDECHPRGIDGAHCLKSDWYEMVGSRQLAVLLAASSAAAPTPEDVWGR